MSVYIIWIIKVQLVAGQRKGSSAARQPACIKGFSYPLLLYPGGFGKLCSSSAEIRWLTLSSKEYYSINACTVLACTVLSPVACHIRTSSTGGNNPPILPDRQSCFLLGPELTRSSLTLPNEIFLIFGCVLALSIYLNHTKSTIASLTHSSHSVCRAIFIPGRLFVCPSPASNIEEYSKAYCWNGPKLWMFRFCFQFACIGGTSISET